MEQHNKENLMQFLKIYLFNNNCLNQSQLFLFGLINLKVNFKVLNL